MWSRQYRLLPGGVLILPQVSSFIVSTQCIICMTVCVLFAVYSPARNMTIEAATPVELTTWLKALIETCPHADVSRVKSTNTRYLGGGSQSKGTLRARKLCCRILHLVGGVSMLCSSLYSRLRMHPKHAFLDSCHSLRFFPYTPTLCTGQYSNKDSSKETDEYKPLDRDTLLSHSSRDTGSQSQKSFDRSISLFSRNADGDKNSFYFASSGATQQVC